MITNTGYKRRTYEEILGEKISKAKELFGDEINTEENTPLGKYIRINAFDQYHTEELAEQIYYSIFPQTSSGQSLDRLGWSVGITRNIATPAQYTVQVTGKAGETVDNGFLVGTDTDLMYHNIADTVIDENGSCLITVECETTGTMGNVSPETITKIINPSATIESVVGVAVVEAGEDAESDYEFLRRYEIVREGKGACNEASILSALLTIPTVQDAEIIANESATETVNNIPPKCIAVYVDGGLNHAQEIGEAIFDKKPIGVGTYGQQPISVAYGGLTDYTVYFSYASNVAVYANITITTNKEFEADGNTAIKENIAAYINSLGMGKTLVTTALYSQIYKVTGVESAIIELSTDGATFGASNVTLAPNERCVLEALTINGETV
jgi:uncharacterized phage protein gp47/JayE